MSIEYIPGRPACDDELLKKQLKSLDEDMQIWLTPLYTCQERVRRIQKHLWEWRCPVEFNLYVKDAYLHLIMLKVVESDMDYVGSYQLYLQYEHFTSNESVYSILEKPFFVAPIHVQLLADSYLLDFLDGYKNYVKERVDVLK